MSDYTELVKALRCCDKYALCNDCPIFETCDGDVDKAMAIAADAIEALQAEVKILKVSGREAYFEGMAANEDPKRGEWVDGDARRVTARCSMCGHLRLGNGAEWANKHVHFCEVCGSRMGDEKA